MSEPDETSHDDEQEGWQPRSQPLPPPGASGFDPEAARRSRPAVLTDEAAGPPDIPPPAWPPSDYEADGSGGDRDGGQRPYPMHFAVRYDAPLSRLSTALRLFPLIPVAVLYYLVNLLVELIGVLGWVAVIFTKRYPRPLFDLMTWGLGWTARAQAYMYLLTDRFPSVEQHAEGPVALEYDYPVPLSRWRIPPWKFLLLLPQFVVLGLLSFAVAVVVVIAWFAILFTGRYPRGLFGFVEGYLRWSFRVVGYFLTLNDAYPPYSLDAEAGPARRGTVIASGLIGLVLGVGLIAATVAVGIYASRPTVIEVDYEALLDGDGSEQRRFRAGDITAVVWLEQGVDPADDLRGAPRIDDDERVVAMRWQIRVEEGEVRINEGFAELIYRERRDDEDEDESPERVVIDGVGRGSRIEEGEFATVTAFFVIPDDAEVRAVRFEPTFFGWRSIEYQFEDD